MNGHVGCLFAFLFFLLQFSLCDWPSILSCRRALPYDSFRHEFSIYSTASDELKFFFGSVSNGLGSILAIITSTLRFQKSVSKDLNLHVFDAGVENTVFLIFAPVDSLLRRQDLSVLSRRSVVEHDGKVFAEISLDSRNSSIFLDLHHYIGTVTQFQGSRNDFALNKDSAIVNVAQEAFNDAKDLAFFFLLLVVFFDLVLSIIWIFFGNYTLSSIGFHSGFK
mmetsp:Transcript_13128/g.23578  ORF Transcript_13128/g.23578 Transcript_13128/m.23578 type:complete len:222 (+) Transcript_13128:685-1350(+)